MNSVSHPENSSSISIAVASKHPIFSDGLEVLALKNDMKFSGAETGQAAFLKLIKEQHVDVGVVDSNMRQESSLQKFIQKIAAGINCILLAEHPEFHNASRYLKAGARGYLGKHNSGASVADAIRKVASGQFAIEEPIQGRVLNDYLHGGEITSPIESISERRLEVFELLGQGKKTSEIAALLHISTKTVDSHRAALMEKMGFENVSQLLHGAVQYFLRRK